MAERTRRRRLIYNEDGDTLGGFRTKLHEAPMSVEDFLFELFAPLVGTHVDTYVWCCGATHGLNVTRPGGERRALWMEHHRTAEGKFLNVHNWRSWCNLQSFLQAGHNPPELIARGARDCGMEMFFSLRMNDAHDAHDPDPEAVAAGSGGINPIKAGHPDWLIGEPGAVYEPKSIPWWMRRAFDYAAEGYRDYVVGIAQEILGFDNDGVELDFMSHPFLFKLGRERQDAPLLTGMIRRVKALAAERDKSLMVRVPGSIERCERIGIDVRTWIREEIVDVLSLGRSVTPATIPTGEWIQAVAGDGLSGVPVDQSQSRSAARARRGAARLRHAAPAGRRPRRLSVQLLPATVLQALPGVLRSGPVWLGRAAGDGRHRHAGPSRQAVHLRLPEGDHAGRLRPRDPGRAGGPAPGAGRGGPAGPRALQDRRPPWRNRAAGDRAQSGGREPSRNATSWSWPSTAAGWWGRSGPTPTSTGRRSPSRCHTRSWNTGGNELEITVRKRNPYIHPPLVFEWAEVSIRYR